jgi:hypothetical protein
MVKGSEGGALRETESAVDAVANQVHIDARGRHRDAVAFELSLEVERGRFSHRRP